MFLFFQSNVYNSVNRKNALNHLVVDNLNGCRLCFRALENDICLPFFSSQSEKNVRKCSRSHEKAKLISCVPCTRCHTFLLLVLSVLCISVIESWFTSSPFKWLKTLSLKSICGFCDGILFLSMNKIVAIYLTMLFKRQAKINGKWLTVQNLRQYYKIRPM